MRPRNGFPRPRNNPRAYLRGRCGLVLIRVTEMDDFEEFDDLPFDDNEWEECTRCGELDELNWAEHCPTCADDMGTSR
jgi:hypothetical protein